MSNNTPKLGPNATLVERIWFYVETEESDKAQHLAALGDYLEECFQWDVSYNTEDL